MPALDKPAKGGDVALAGPDGKRAAELVERSQAHGTALLYSITKTALTRLAEHGPFAVLSAGALYSPEELQQLTQAFGGTIVGGDLLGRSRTREKMNKASVAQGLYRFAEVPWSIIPDLSIPFMVPEAAVRYFMNLWPMIGIQPERYLPIMQREAFTLANQTERTILTRVQEVITQRLQTGEEWRTAPHEIEMILQETGVHPTNPQYSEMVFRTNMMDAFNTGQQLEVLHNPEVSAALPVWQYLGIRDGREGEDHRPHFDLYYPSSLSFHVVRGKRVYNCRCTPSYIDRWTWDRLRNQGASLSYV